MRCFGPRILGDLIPINTDPRTKNGYQFGFHNFVVLFCTIDGFNQITLSDVVASFSWERALF